MGKNNRAEEKHVELEPPVSQRQCLDRPGPLCTRIVNDCVESASGRDFGPDGPLFSGSRDARRRYRA